MLTDEQRKRFFELRQQEEDGALEESGREELNNLIQAVEAEDAETLRPATERIRQQRLQYHAQNEAVKTLLDRQERLVRRLERVLALSHTESTAIQSRLTEILAPSPAGVDRR